MPNINAVTPDPENEVDHASAIYDPAVHEDQLVAVFPSATEANTALQSLKQLGIAADAQVVTGTAEASHDTMFWSVLKALFAPDDEMTHYQEGLRRGHALLVVHPDPANRLPIINAIEAAGPIDFDVELEKWRAAGWANLAKEQAATMGAETTAPAGQEGPSASSAAASDTAARDAMQSRAGVIGRRDQAGAGNLVRAYTSRPES